MGDTFVEPVESGSSSSQIPAEELQCTICLSAEFAQECRVNGCNHSFCFSCISEWVCQSIRPSCPMCRHDIDNIFYDFTEREARKQIGIKEYRSSQMSISQTDRAQLFGERRVIVRNLMHAYKLLALLASEIAELESKESEETAKNDLRTLEENVLNHINDAEKSLIDLRTEVVRKNKSLVFKTLTFRRVVYTNKIKVKYPEQKREKLTPEDISKDPNRFKGMITDFLLAEFEAIPFQIQPKVAGHKWRTKFLGGELALEEKKRIANDIYQLMLSTPTGSDDFHKELEVILAPVSNGHVQFLEDHLEAIMATHKEKIEEFYQEVYYDSIYNSFPNSFFDYNAMLNMRDDPQLRFEALFSQIHPFDFLDPFGPRLHRQLSNTDRTDRATNNDADSDRSSSPEERTPTPMPDEDTVMFHAFHSVDELPPPTHFVFRPLAIRRRMAGDLAHGEIHDDHNTNRTTSMTLRSSTRREREQEENPRYRGNSSASTSNNPGTSSRQGRRQTIQDFDNRSRTMASLFQRPHPPQTVTVRLDSRHPNRARPAVPEYHAPGHPIDRSSLRGVYRLETLGRMSTVNPTMEAYLSDPIPTFSLRRLTHRSPSPYPPPPVETERPDTRGDQETAEQIAAAINQEDADNGLDFISVARRTRSARRAAGEGTLPGAPPPKRATTSRRGRR